MKKAAQATEVLKEMKNFQDPTVVKKALVTQKAKVEVQETKEQRAARYFATHGLKKIGHALGEELSVDAEKKALQEQATLEKKLSEAVPVPASQASHSSGNTDLPDIDMDEDDDQ